MGRQFDDATFTCDAPGCEEWQRSRVLPSGWSELSTSTQPVTCLCPDHTTTTLMFIANIAELQSAAVGAPRRVPTTGTQVMDREHMVLNQRQLDTQLNTRSYEGVDRELGRRAPRRSPSAGIDSAPGPLRRAWTRWAALPADRQGFWLLLGLVFALLCIVLHLVRLVHR